jgi:hypothetical protein
VDDACAERSPGGGDDLRITRAANLRAAGVGGSDGLSQATRVRIAALACVAGGILIMGLLARGRRIIDDRSIDERTWA